MIQVSYTVLRRFFRHPLKYTIENLISVIVVLRFLNGNGFLVVDNRRRQVHWIPEQMQLKLRDWKSGHLL